MARANVEVLMDQGTKLIQFYRENPCIAAYDLLKVDLAAVQRVVFEDMWFRNYVITVAGRGFGKSNDINSLCHFKGKGLIYLYEELPTVPTYLNDGEEEIIKWHDEVFTSKGFKPTKKLCLEKGIVGKELITQNGFENRGSNHHPLLTLNSSCEFEYKSLEDFKPGDRLCIQREQQVFGNNRIVKDDAYLIGLFIGDGLISDQYNHVDITTSDTDIIKFCISYCDSNNIEYRIDEDKRTDSTVKIVFKNFDWFFEKYNIKRCLSYDKCVPYSIRTATQESQIEFLRGYFDADGTANSENGGVSCCSVSKKLLKEIQLMLLNFGIVAKLRKKKTKSDFGKAYLLDMFSYDALLFKDRIGFKLGRKQQIINNYFNDRKLNVNKDTIPYALELCYDITKYYHDTYKTSKKPSFRIRTGNKKELTYERLYKFLLQCREVEESGFSLDGVIDKLNKLATIIYSHYYFDTVESVESWTGDCYDFEMDMEGEPNYFANGFISHNTFLLGTLSALSCMLYPGYRVGLIAPVFRQSKMIFSEVEKLYSRSSLLREATEKRPTRGSDTCYLKFKSVGGYNPSYIEALPLGDGCLSADTYLTFSDRFDKISCAHGDITNNHYVDRSDYVWSNGDFQESDRSLCNGLKETIRIKTAKGFKSEGTPNHMFKVVRNGEVIWCRFDEMVVGDKVLIDRSYRWHNGKSDITEEQAYALGLMLGDGSWTNKYRLRYTTKDKELIEHLENGSGYDFYMCSDEIHYNHDAIQDVSEWLSFWDMPVSYAIDKKLPARILGAERNVMSACLSGLYDSDGHVQVSTLKGGISITIGFTNTSEELIDQMHYILLHYGIVAYKTSRNRDDNWNVSYELLITGSDVKIFYEEIGFKLKRKKEILEAAVNNKTRWIKNDSVPYIKRDMIAISSENRIKRGEGTKESRYTRASLIKSKRSITQYMADCFLKTYGHLKDPRIDRIVELANPDIYYDEIVYIGSGEKVTYDIHVPNGNEYCANGFFSHNSKIRGSRFYLIVVDELAQVPDQTLDMVVRPMGATTLEPMENVRRLQRQRKLIELGLATEDDFEDETVNKMIMTSSGFYKFNHMWRRMKDHWKQMDEHGDESQYRVWQIPYWDLPDGFLDKNNIMEAKRIMSDAEFRMEYEAAMISDSEGFFKASVLEACTNESGFTLEVRGEPGAEYVVGVDPAQGGDASCGVVIIKYGNPNRVVNVLELKRKTTQDLTMMIQAICDAYNVIRFFIDKGGGGKAIMDLLEDGYNDYEPLIDRTDDDKRHLKGRHILEMVNFNPSWIADANFTTLSLLEDKKLLFPEPPTSSADILADAYSNVLTLKKQMLNIIVTQTGSGVLHFDTPKKGQNKDLYSALILAAHGCRTVAKELEAEPDPILFQKAGYIREHKPNAPWNVLNQKKSLAPGSPLGNDRGLNHAILKNKKRIK